MIYYYFKKENNYEIIKKDNKPIILFNKNISLKDTDTFEKYLVNMTPYVDGVTDSHITSGATPIEIWQTDSQCGKFRMSSPNERFSSEKIKEFYDDEGASDEYENKKNDIEDGIHYLNDVAFLCQKIDEYPHYLDIGYDTDSSTSRCIRTYGRSFFDLPKEPGLYLLDNQLIWSEHLLSSKETEGYFILYVK